MRQTGDSGALSVGGNRNRALLLFFLTFAVYFFPHKYHGGGDASPAELLPISILNGHGLDLTEFADRRGGLPYYFSYREGRVISSYPVMSGLMNLPVYAVARAFGTDLQRRRNRLSLLSGALITAGSAVFLFLALTRLTSDRSISFGFAALYAFGTNAWSNGALSMLQHGSALLFLCAALAALLAEKPAVSAFAGILLGFAVVSRPTTIAFALPLTVFAYRERRRGFPLFALLALVPASLLYAYSTMYWGSWKTLGQGQGGWGFDGVPGVSLPGLLVSPSRGLLIFTPFFLFAFAHGFVVLVRRAAPGILRYLFAGCLLTIGIYAFWGAWWGGASFSYRLLTELSPALVMLCADAWQAWIRPRPTLRRIFGVTAGFSILVQLLGAVSFPSAFNERIDRETARLWDWKRSELPLDAAKLMRKLGLRRHDLSVRHLPPPPPAPEGWYEEPNAGDVIRGSTVRGSGWAASADGIGRIAVLLDGRDVGSATYGQYRPAVRHVKPYVQCGDFCGFRYRIDGVPPGRHTIQTRFFGRQGGTGGPSCRQDPVAP